MILVYEQYDEKNLTELVFDTIFEVEVEVFNVPQTVVTDVQVQLK